MYLPVPPKGQMQGSLAPFRMTASKGKEFGYILLEFALCVPANGRIGAIASIAKGAVNCRLSDIHTLKSVYIRRVGACSCVDVCR
jgi:hypothetical protein